MRVLVVFVALFLAACQEGGGFARPSHLGRKVTIDRSYEARDACLARNAAADGTSTTDATTLAHAVAMACQSETQKLIAATDANGDAAVADKIRRDSEFRAMKFVMQARGQAIF